MCVGVSMFVCAFVYVSKAHACACGGGGVYVCDNTLYPGALINSW